MLTDTQMRAFIAQAKKTGKPFTKGNQDNTGAVALFSKTGSVSLQRRFRFEGRDQVQTFGQYAVNGVVVPEEQGGISLRLWHELSRASKATQGQGINPIVQQKDQRAEAELAREAKREQERADKDAELQRKQAAKEQQKADALTVRAVCEKWIAYQTNFWTNDDTRQQVVRNFEQYVFGVPYGKQPAPSKTGYRYGQLGEMPISTVVKSDILKLTNSTLVDVRETSRRLFERLGAAWRWAESEGLTNTNPVRLAADDFGKAFKNALRRHPTKSFPTLSWGPDLAQFLRAVDGYSGDPVTLAAVKLLSLTMLRTGELRPMRWSEVIDLGGNEPHLKIPRARMKVKEGKDDHIVPLSRQAVQILAELREITGPNGGNPGTGDGEGLLFPQARKRYQMVSENAVLVVINAVGFKGRMTGHGFRGIASTYLHEMGQPHAAIELQLDHEVGNAVEQAYNRAKLLAQRRAMLQFLADTYDGLKEDRPAGSNVVSIRPAEVAA